MNWLDTAMVASTSLEYVSHVSIRHARLLRIVRMARVVRVFRMVAEFRQLRHLVCSLVSSIAAMFYTFIMMMVIIFCFALVFVQSVIIYLETATATDPVAHALADQFGGIVRAMVTLFSAISGGNDWLET